MPRVLYQLPRSPFSRKARWVMALKRCETKIVDVAPGDRDEVRRLSGQEELPLLLSADHVVAGAKAIAFHLEREIPEPSLFPSDSRRRNQAVTLDAFADDAFGQILAGLFPERIALGDAVERSAGASLGGSFSELRDALERTREAMRRGAIDAGGVYLGDIAVAAHLASVREIPALRFARDYADLDAFIERVRAACGAID